MTIHRLKKGALIANYGTFGSPKSAMLANRRELAKRTTTCIEGRVSYVDQIAMRALLFIIDHLH